VLPQGGERKSHTKTWSERRTGGSNSKEGKVLKKKNEAWEKMEKGGNERGLGWENVWKKKTYWSNKLEKKQKHSGGGEEVNKKNMPRIKRKRNRERKSPKVKKKPQGGRFQKKIREGRDNSQKAKDDKERREKENKEMEKEIRGRRESKVRVDKKGGKKKKEAGRPKKGDARKKNTLGTGSLKKKTLPLKEGLGGERENTRYGTCPGGEKKAVEMNNVGEKTKAGQKVSNPLSRASGKKQRKAEKKENTGEKKKGHKRETIKRAGL